LGRRFGQHRGVPHKAEEYGHQSAAAPGNQQSDREGVLCVKKPAETPEQQKRHLNEHRWFRPSPNADEAIAAAKKRTRRNRNDGRVQPPVMLASRG